MTTSSGAISNRSVMSLQTTRFSTNFRDAHPGGSTQANKSVEDSGHSYTEVAQSLTIGYTLTEKLGAYTECYALFPSGAISPDIKPQYYFDGGFTYRLTNNIQFDINAGVGLNRYANDYFLGTGIVLRY